jgi:hypothetical protein
VKFLVDVNVLSEGTKSRPAPAARDWLVAHRGLIAINPIILGELELGIRLMPDGRRKNQLRQWLEGNAFALPVLEIDRNTGIVWAALLNELRTQVNELRTQGRAMPLEDSLIAATARQHGLTVATRNVSHYRYAGVAVVNPFES